MKKIAIFFFIIIAIVSTIAYVYLNYIYDYRNAQKENSEFKINKDEEIEGSELTTLINKAIDTNIKNEVQKDNKGKYRDNGNNSINIDIQFLDNDVTYNMEMLYNSGMQNFLYYYGNIKFKCIDVQYHKETGKIKYIKFEQTTT